MKVAQILKSKADDSVFTVKPSATIAEVSTILTEKRIGTVVVSEDGKTPDGIVSERDIVTALSRTGSGCLIGTVDDFMTRPVMTCSLEATADQVLTMMTERRFRHIPVVENGEMVGLISVGDVVKARLSELSMEKDALEGMIMGF